MAPRRGGGGSGLSFDTSASSCSSRAFDDTYSRVLIAFYAIFFLVYAALACGAAFRFFRSKGKSRALLRWWPLGISILFGLISLILAIIFYVTTQCRVIDSWVTEQSGFIAANWLTGISRYLLIATIMIPIIRRLHQSAGKKKKKKTTLITAIHGVYLAILAIILICRLSIYTYMKYKQGLDGDYYLHRYKAHLVQNYPRIVTAYDVLGVVGILMASGNMVLLLVRNSALWRMTLKAQIILLIIAALGMTVLDLASDIDETYITHGLRYMMQSSNAVMFLGLFFYSCTFVAALSVAASRQLSTAWSTYPQMDPVFPQQQQQQQQAYGNAAMPQYHYPQCQNPAPQGYPQSGA